MLPQTLSEAFEGVKAVMASALLEAFEAVTQFVLQYQDYILIGIIIIIIMGTLNLLVKRQEKRKRQHLQEEIDEIEENEIKHKE